MSGLLRLLSEKALWLLGLLLLAGQAAGHGSAPPSLQGVAVPGTPGLLDGRKPIVVDKRAAVRLGKALFWDANIGSDGMACASCHFHAGADSRVTNQLAPGIFHADSPTATTFEPTASGAAGGPNYTLKASDFPLHQLANPDDKKSAVLFDSDDVVSSAGVFPGDFQSVASEGDSQDQCAAKADAVFHLDGLNTRRVEPRNTPTVINAAFNFRNFWDGRANHQFNGASPFGPRDPDAGVWVLQDNGKPSKERLLLDNASLASQAVGPPLSDSEMSCSKRTFPEIGRKVLARRPLESQEVHAQDSVLGKFRHASGKGLDSTYAELIQQAFASRYWSGKGGFGAAQSGGQAYSQMEANFSFFFGLALQLYQQTLVADQTPFDTPRDEAGVPSGLGAQQARGLDVFLGAHCDLCHKGPTFSSAAHPDVYAAPNPAGPVLVNRKTLNGVSGGSGIVYGLMDEGFANTSVTSTAYDPGIGGLDPFGNPLSFTEQYLQVLLGQADSLVDGIAVKACQFEVPFSQDYAAKELVNDPFGNQGCGSRSLYAKTPASTVLQAELSKPGQGRALAAVPGAFKIPTLRNVELTGPYMHNGSMKTLEEVVDFYNRGGNFDNPQHFATLVFPQGLSADNKADLVAFLRSLTDERVRWERAPFDHPQLLVPHGQVAAASPQNPDLAKDRYVSLPAVGRQGRSASQGPLQPWHELLSSP